ncbi:hypothetical protein [Bacteroides sp. Phil13]|uniref:hypothetical protein n=1 Tax=Bacteroides sp. Phil13 TaxID=1929999 RepID=UPI00257A57B3|nr:hypothetical protein [Bacteroides sp. Phil13]
MVLEIEGGVLAVQIPVIFSEPVHQVIQEVVHREHWSSLLKYNRELDMLSEEEYFDLLADITSDFTTWRDCQKRRKWNLKVKC